MPLLDPNQPPMNRVGESGWRLQWAGHILSHLNENVLDQTHCADFHVHHRRDALDLDAVLPGKLPEPLTECGFAPRPQFQLMGDFVANNFWDVLIRREVDRRIVAAVMLVGPSEAASPSILTRFAARVVSRTIEACSVVVVNIVAAPLVCPHTHIGTLLGLPQETKHAVPAGPSVLVYRVAPVGETTRLDVWPHALTVGQPLPTVPLWLAADLVVPLDLEATYVAMCRSLRLG